MFAEKAWLIPLLPALSFFVILFFGKKLPKGGAESGILTVGTSFVLAVIVAAQWLKDAKVVDDHLTWWSNGKVHITIGQHVDGLTVMMLAMVTFVSLMVHVYSTGYMHGDVRFTYFFAALSLFTASMLFMVLADNLLQLMIGWELVGLCSFMLIGHWFEEKNNSSAALKAFFTTKFGDVGLVLGTITLFFAAGQTFHIETINRLALDHDISHGLLLAGALLLFLGVMGKSAQFPLHVWLPDAMAGPTPVSALIHAATMVTAGVYMVARSNALFSLAPHTLTIVAVVGAFTAILAASIGLVQNDIKRVLAYSTVSQLGYMVLALGVGAYWVAVFHLFTHAFFKALLFLGSGSVIHAMSGEQDMRRMGALKDKIPTTHFTMFIGSLAIAGIPGLAGFFSKDEILWQTFSSPLGSKALYAVGLTTAGMTAFYMWRLMNMTFYGKSRVAPDVAAKIHESPASMTIPLQVLALGSVLAGWLSAPKIWTDKLQLFEHWLAPVFGAEGAHAAAEEASHSAASLEWLLMGVSVTIAVIGIYIARVFYNDKPEIPESLEARLPGLHRSLLNKWYLDEIYDFLFVNGLCKGGGRLLGAFDRNVVDGAVNGAGWITRFSATASMWWDTWIIDGAVRLSSFLVKILSYPVRILQTGQVQSYALFIVVGAIVFFGYYMVGR